VGGRQEELRKLVLKKQAEPGSTVTTNHLLFLGYGPATDMFLLIIQTVILRNITAQIAFIIFLISP